MPFGIIEITIPNGRRMRRSGVFVHQAVALPDVDVTIVDAIPVTTATRTLIDLASVLTATALEEVLDDALRRRLTTIPRLRGRLVELGRKGRRGIATISGLVEARGEMARVPDSVLETRFLRLVKEAGLPRPACQYPVRVQGRLVAMVHFAYPHVLLAIETEGYRWHSGRVHWSRDLARRNELTALGWRVIHVTWIDLRDHAERTIKLVADALQG